jgi:RimJ/RimL family protein N-acetyltransferase
MKGIVPEIATERLLLRGMGAADFAAFAAVWADPIVVAQVGVPGRSEAESWRAFLANLGQWQVYGMGQWTICDRSSGVYLGQTGFFDAKRGYGGDFDRFPEAGWVLAREAIGRGIGGEAAAAAHRWFYANLGGPSVAQIEVGNAASLALAARLGYVAYARMGTGERALALLRRG